MKPRGVLLGRPWIAVGALAFLSGCGGSEPEPVPSVEEEAPDPNAPGVRQISDDLWEVVVYAYEGGFDPNEIRVPAGAQVRFRARSTDPTFVHGFLIEGTPVELEVENAGFSEATHTFEEPGEYPFACYVYCGGGHPAMLGRVIVE